MVPSALHAAKPTSAFRKPQEMKFDLVIIGGGSAGFAAARTASDLGANVAIVDKGPLGGLCILRGCMPSKTLLRSSDIMALMKRASEFGLSTGKLGADMGAINDRKKKLIKEFADYRAGQLKDPKYNLIKGTASFLDPNRIKVGKKTIESEAFIITTGSNHARVPVPGLEEAGYLTSDELLDSRTIYKSMIVLGRWAHRYRTGSVLLPYGYEDDSDTKKCPHPQFVR